MEEKEEEKTFIAGTVIKENGKYLLVQEIDGLFGLPAGKSNYGELPEGTAIRETREETGYEVEIIRKINIDIPKKGNKEGHFFEARIIGGELKWPTNEIQNVEPFTFEQIE